MRQCGLYDMDDFSSTMSYLLFSKKRKSYAVKNLRELKSQSLSFAVNNILDLACTENRMFHVTWNSCLLLFVINLLQYIGCLLLEQTMLSPFLYLHLHSSIVSSFTCQKFSKVWQVKWVKSLGWFSVTACLSAFSREKTYYF